MERSYEEIFEEYKIKRKRLSKREQIAKKAPRWQASFFCPSPKWLKTVDRIHTILQDFRIGDVLEIKDVLYFHGYSLGRFDPYFDFYICYKNIRERATFRVFNSLKKDRYQFREDLALLAYKGMLTNTEEIKKVSDAPEWQNLLKKLTIHLFTLQKLKDKEAERLKAYNNTYKREAELFNELVLAWARNEKALKPGDMFYWPLHVVIPEKVEFLYEEDSQYYVKTVDGETESISKVIYEKERFEKSSKYRELEMFTNEWPV